MKTYHNLPLKLITAAPMEKLAKMWLPRQHPPLVGHIEVLEVRGIFKNIVKCQLNGSDKNMNPQTMKDEETARYRRKSEHRRKGRKDHEIGGTKTVRGRKDKMAVTKRKIKNMAAFRKNNGPQVKRVKKNSEKRNFREAEPSKMSKLQSDMVKRKLMMRKEGEMYSEVKQKAPKVKQIEFFAKPRKRQRARGGRLTDAKSNFYNKESERNVSFSELPHRDELREFLYGTEGRLLPAYKEATTINNDLTTLNIHTDRNRQRHNKGVGEVFSIRTTAMLNGSRGTNTFTHVTTSHTELFSMEEKQSLPNDLNTTESEEYKSLESEEYKSSLKASAYLLYLYSQGEIMSTVSNRENEDAMQSVTKRSVTPSWNNTAVIPKENIIMNTSIPLDSLIKTQVELQPGTNRSNTDDPVTDQSLLSNSVSEGSGDAEVKLQLDHEYRTLQLTQTTPVQSLGSTLHSSTGQRDVEMTVITGATEDSVLDPQEIVMNHGPDTVYCRAGYKLYAGACRSLCDTGEFSCRNGGQCVIVENMGAMCRCHQTNHLCYRGECCRFSLTPLQLICVIGSCCIFVSVFLASISLLIRRMDIKAVSKSARTRLWISTLMPGSSSHSVASDFTACSDCDYPQDLPPFNCKKEVTYEGSAFKYERTRL
ncbi:uncharacterized protein [Hyperolius riggenbachi]|uniref:uncharacterized protein n=1 Tax=Hyperolius riggenbachi TaxID=752182 RepID=UPI0035A2B6FB